MQLAEILDALNGLPPEQRKQVEQEAIEATKHLKWVPNPGPQTEAYYCEADELFFGGEAGGGKSDIGIGLSLNEHERSLILREFNEDARALGDRLIQIVRSDDGWNGQLLRYKAQDLLVEFAGVPNEKDKQRHKGNPHDLIVFDEVGDFFESQYTFIIGWNRSTTPGQRCRVVATGNPPTRAKGLWVIKRWGAWLDPTHPNPAKPGELRWYTTDEEGRDVEVDGPGPHLIGGEMVRAKSRTFIRSKLSDNPDLASTNYASTLAALPKELRDAYRDGRFDASLKDDPHQIIPTSWIRLAQQRWTSRPPQGVPMCAMGVDASGGGEDPMVMAPRHDGWFAPLIAIPGKDIPVDRIGPHCAGLVVSHRRDDALVIVDMGGGYGGSMHDHLKANGVEVCGYKGAEGTTKRSRDGKLKLVNVRTAAYWSFREALDPAQEGGSPIMLPEDPELVADLTAATFEVTPHGIRAESKEKVCERLGRSTDKGDAAVMSWWTGPKMITHFSQWRADQRAGGARNAPLKANLGPRRR
jgi:hypothetical protein